MAISSGAFSTLSADTLPFLRHSVPKAIISASACTFTPPSVLKKCQHVNRRNLKLFMVRASSDEPDDCNDEECAPEKEVGKVSMDWLAGDKTKVIGTYPPRSRGWTGYVEKDTAGQTNIYSVEPAVYVAESAISSGAAGSSSSGAENTAAITAGLALLSVAAASSILFQVSKNPPQVQTVEYSGPSLSYYINKFKATEIVEAAALSQPESSASVQSENSAPQVTQVEVQSEYQPEPSAVTAEGTS